MTYECCGSELVLSHLCLLYQGCQCEKSTRVNVATEQLQATVEAQSKSYAAALKTGGRSKAQAKKKSRYDKTNRTMNNQSESSQTSSVKHSPSKQT